MEKRRKKKRIKRLNFVFLFLSIILGIIIGYLLPHPLSQNKTQKSESSSVVHAKTQSPSKKTTPSSSREVAPSFPATQPAMTPQEAEINNQLKPYIGSQVGTLLIVRNGQIHFERGYGYFDAAKKIENNPNAQYQILSAQKTITAQMIMNLVENGQLSLTDKVSKFYPQLKNGDQIEIKNLLNMTSGLVKPTSLPTSTDDLTIADWTASNVTSNGKVGQWNYIDQNYVLLAGIVVKLTGTSYQKLFDQDFKAKLGLSHSGFVYNKDEVINLATPYHFTYQVPYSAPIVESDAQRYSELGAGNIAMTPGDFYTLISSILQNKTLSAQGNVLLHSLGTVTSGYSGGMYKRINYYTLSGVGYGYELKAKFTNDGKNAVIFMSNSFPTANDLIQQQLVANIFRLEFGL